MPHPRAEDLRLAFGVDEADAVEQIAAAFEYVESSTLCVDHERIRRDVVLLAEGVKAPLRVVAEILIAIAALELAREAKGGVGVEGHADAIRGADHGAVEFHSG